MQLFVLYTSTALVFLILDALMLTRVIKPAFATHIGPLLAEPIRMGPAVVFYLFYIGGLLYFASLPALRADNALQALLVGGLLGAMAYGTYEFTNYATLKDWHWQMVALDLTWGTVLTGVSAWAGVVITRALT
ncbi:MAG: DUF2177 family protein [Rhodobacterales bacterium]